MGWFGPKKIVCPAGKWTSIISTSFAQIPVQFDVRFEGDVVGEFEEKKSRWVFPGVPRRGSLAEKMTFERGYWNTFYAVQVCPTSDVTAVVD